MTIGVTAVGTVEKNDLVRRDGARPNDLVCVTGDLAPHSWVFSFWKEKELFIKDKVTQPDLSGYEYVIERQLKPEFRFQH